MILPMVIERLINIKLNILHIYNIILFKIGNYTRYIMLYSKIYGGFI